MFPYLLLVSPIALIATLAPARRIYPFLWALAFVAIWIFVGLRHHVGMDWNNYLGMMQKANIGSLADAFSVAEPGYAILLWVSGQAGWGIYGAYFIGTLIFLAGLFRYVRTTPYPWIALMAAMPYLVIVISMSAARQSVAVGVLLWLAAGWSHASIYKRIALVLLASSFHISAAGFLILVVLGLRVRIWIKAVGAILLGGAVIYLLTVSGQADFYNSAYGLGQTALTQSSGAYFHVLLVAGPALLAFLVPDLRRSLRRDPLLFNLALISFFLFFLVPFFSTAASRLSLYMHPVPITILATLPQFFRASGARTLVRLLIVSWFFLVLIFWLSYGKNSSAHLNYQNLLFVPDHLLQLCC